MFKTNNLNENNKRTFIVDLLHLGKTAVTQSINKIVVHLQRREMCAFAIFLEQHEEVGEYVSVSDDIVDTEGYVVLLFLITS